MTVENAQDLGLNGKEFEKIKQELGRIPNLMELTIFSVMWAEDCSLKSSVKWLKTLPSEGHGIVSGTGEENARLVDIGDGLACVFKFAKQNQAALNGSADIHRDLFAKGARPVATLQSHRLSNPDLKEGKEVVHSLSLGTVQLGENISACADGPGNPVFVVGSFSDVDNADFVQEKRLLEASLEAIRTGAVVGMHGMGAAGLVRSAAVMCAKSGTGMDIQLERMPSNQQGLSASEILLEHQDCLLLVAKAGEEELLTDVFGKWSLECTQIGEVTDSGLLQYFHQGEKMAEVPAQSLVAGWGAPVYDQKTKRPDYYDETRKFNLKQVKLPTDFPATARQLLTAPSLLSKYWLCEQHDSRNIDSPSDAAVVQLGETGKSLLVTVECNTAYVYSDPHLGTMIAVAEAARNITCTGGMPVAVSNSLYFGEAENPEAYLQFVGTMKGLGDACRKIGTPVAGSTVHFYDKTEDGGSPEPVAPVPAIGMLGVLEKPEHLTTLDFKSEGDLIYMLGNSQNDLGSSEYLRAVQGVQLSPPPEFDLADEMEVQQHVRKLIRMGKLRSAHGVSVGGLFANLMESATVNGLGFNVETVETFRKDCFLFGESQSRIVLTIDPEQEDALQNYLVGNNVSFTKLGEIIGTDAVIDGENFGHVNHWKRTFEGTLIKK